jgi:hypothetical protein
MQPFPVKIRSVKATCEQPVLRVVKSWKGPCVLMAGDPGSTIKVDRPDRVVVPLYGNMSPLSRQLAARNLVRVTPFACDVYVVEVMCPSGPAGYGMFTVPRAHDPKFFVDER